MVGFVIMRRKIGPRRTPVKQQFCTRLSCKLDRAKTNRARRKSVIASLLQIEKGNSCVRLGDAHTLLAMQP